jgi:hypothetical protein
MGITSNFSETVQDAGRKRMEAGVAAIPGTPALRRLRQKDESKAGPAATE